MTQSKRRAPKAPTTMHGQEKERRVVPYLALLQQVHPPPSLPSLFAACAASDNDAESSRRLEVGMARR